MQQQERPQEAIAPILVFFVIVGAVLAAVFALQPRATIPAGSQPSVVVATPSPQAVAVAATPTLDVGAAAALAAAGLAVPGAGDPLKGEQVFQGTCAACHGFNALGISGLGKPLIGSKFANSLTDDELVAFITRGRPPSDPLNTTGQLMPPRGGNMALTDDDLKNVVAYIRKLNGANVMTASNATAVPTLEILPTVGPFVAPDINALPAGIVPPSSGASGALDLTLSDGKSAYVWACSGCHGLDGHGLANFGPDLAQSKLSDSNLIAFLIQGRLVTDGAPHPALGGYPALSDPQLRDVTAYLKALVKAQ